MYHRHLCFSITGKIIFMASILMSRIHASSTTSLRSGHPNCDEKGDPFEKCRHFERPKELNVESPLFFGSTGEKDDVLDCVPKSQNGFYGITTATRTQIEFLYEVDYDFHKFVGNLDTKTVFLIEQAISNAIVPTLFTSSCEDINFINRNLHTVGVSTWPADVILEGVKCALAGTSKKLSSCNVVKGQMHIYTKDGFDGALDGVSALTSIQSMMDSGKFNNMNDKIIHVRYVNGTVSDTDVIVGSPPAGSPTSDGTGSGGGLASGDFPIYGFILIALVPLILMATVIIKRRHAEAQQPPTEDEARSWLTPRD